MKEKIEQIIAKLRTDDKLLEKFQKNPASVIEEYLGVDLPDDQVNQIVEGVKAKLQLDKLGSALGGSCCFGGRIPVRSLRQKRCPSAAIKWLYQMIVYTFFTVSLPADCLLPGFAGAFFPRICYNQGDLILILI